MQGTNRRFEFGCWQSLKHSRCMLELCTLLKQCELREGRIEDRLLLRDI
jgi:hypothetical protein